MVGSGLGAMHLCHALGLDIELGAWLGLGLGLGLG